MAERTPRHGADLLGDAIGVGEAAAGLEDQQMRVGRDDLVADPVLEPGHHGEHHDQGRHAEEHAADADPDEERQVRALPARGEIPQPEEELERQAALHAGDSGEVGSASPSSGGASGRSRGNRMTSRIDGWLAKSMTSRSMPIPSPAAGGMPYSSART